MKYQLYEVVSGCNAYKYSNVCHDPKVAKSTVTTSKYSRKESKFIEIWEVVPENRIFLVKVAH